ncbi:MAG: hypothetical protein U5K70_03785 [Halodesulfurarchaeum sp.]|nr:hypothetical protein [Halodesulfurarchaeum sp.]
MSTRLRALEAVYWVFGGTTVAILGLGVLAFVVGDGLLTLKYLLFVVGFLLFGVGSFALWRGTRRRPTIWPSMDVGPDTTDEIGLERRLWELPGLRGEYLPPSDRVSRPVKLFLTGVFVLAVSYVMEAVFGISV